MLHFFGALVSWEEFFLLSWQLRAENGVWNTLLMLELVFRIFPDDRMEEVGGNDLRIFTRMVKVNYCLVLDGCQGGSTTIV